MENLDNIKSDLDRLVKAFHRDGHTENRAYLTAGSNDIYGLFRFFLGRWGGFVSTDELSQERHFNCLPGMVNLKGYYGNRKGGNCAILDFWFPLAYASEDGQSHTSLSVSVIEDYQETLSFYADSLVKEILLRNKTC